MPSETTEEEVSTRTCKNCPSRLTGPYCSVCGQRDFDFKQDWKSLLEEYVSSMFNFDGKVPRGIFCLLFKPGHNSREFLDGKRFSQIPPIRLYLFTSLLFFLFATNVDLIDGTDYDKSITEMIESVPKPTPEDSEMEAYLTSKFDDPRQFVNDFEDWLPKVALIAVPLFAIVTRLVFWRRNLIYIEHLIIAMHMISFYMMWRIISTFASLPIGLFSKPASELFIDISNFWIVIYPVFSFRRIFDLTWMKAIGASLVIEFCSLLLLAATVSGAIGIAFLLA
ncbi:MAG: DUF3667 domain-containing protein [Verrucomicrobiota bacterium]